MRDMTHTILSALLTEGSRQIPDTLAAMCIDLRTGAILASEPEAAEPGEVAELAQAASRLFARGQRSALSDLWDGLSDDADAGDEVILLEQDRCFVLLRASAPPFYAVVFVTGRNGNVGLTIARTRAVKTDFEDALRRL